MSDFLFLPSHPSVSSAHYAAMKPLWEMLADAGQKALTVTILDLPWNHQCYDAYHSMVRHIRRRDGSWTFDYRVFDEYVAFGRSCGIGPWIACYTMCPWDYAVSWEDEDGGVHTERAVPGTEAFERYWGPFLTDFAAHLKEKGWLGDTWLCMDERKPSDVQNICRFIAEKAPGLKTFLELRNGIVAAEKFCILKEQDSLKKKDFASLAAKFDRKAAMENTCDFAKLRSSVQKLVNKGR